MRKRNCLAYRRGLWFWNARRVSTRSFRRRSRTRTPRWPRVARSGPSGHRRWCRSSLWRHNFVTVRRHTFNFFLSIASLLHFGRFFSGLDSRFSRKVAEECSCLKLKRKIFIMVMFFRFFVVLACHLPVLDGFDWHFQASVHLTLSSAVNKSQRHRKIGFSDFLGSQIPALYIM